MKVNEDVTGKLVLPFFIQPITLWDYPTKFDSLD
jgi:hypothetical protein